MKDRKQKTSFSMLLDPKVYDRMDKAAFKHNVPKVRIVTLALNELFKSKKLESLIE